MKSSTGPRANRIFVSIALCGLVALALQGCGTSDSGATGGGGGTNQTSRASAGSTTSGSTHASGGSSGGPASGGGSSGGGSGGSAGAKHMVAMLQASKALATDLTMSDVADLVASAVSQAGGLDFIKDGQTVVLKPNLPTFYVDAGTTIASSTASGTATDWRVVKVVADLVRAKNPKGKVLVMEGSTLPTTVVYALLGYQAENFGSSVDEFIALEGTSCDDTSTAALEQRSARSGKPYWVNRRYLTADVVISIPTMATNAWTGIGGAVENLGVGASPAGQYGGAENQDDCTRAKIDHSSPKAMGEFIRDYYGIRPADFVVMDGLQGLEHGPLPAWDDSGTLEYTSSIKNMRLVLAGRNAVAVDTIQALVMKCDPRRVPHLTKLETDGLGTTDPAKITVVGKQVSDVATAFAGKQTDICPGE